MTIARRSFLAGLVPLSLLHGDELSRRTIWIDFIKWVDTGAEIRTQRTPDFYLSQLAVKGVSAAELEARGRFIRDRSPEAIIEQMEYFWEYIGSLPTSNSFRVKPSPWLAECVKGLKAGKALDLGMGSGRNCLFLAGKGWDVTGVDMSAAGIQQAKQQALLAGVTYSAVVADLEKWDFGKEKWDLIAAIYGPNPGWADRMLQSLKIGGLLVGVNGVFDPALPEN